MIVYCVEGLERCPAIAHPSTQASHDSADLIGGGRVDPAVIA